MTDMLGPKPNGFWSHLANPKFQFLEAGKQYRVVEEFRDFDKVVHLAGEEWKFVGYSFLPYDDGLSLFVQNDAGEWHIRMQLRDDEQNQIVANLEKYIQLVIQ